MGEPIYHARSHVHLQHISVNDAAIALPPRQAAEHDEIRPTTRALRRATPPSHGENRGSSPLGSAKIYQYEQYVALDSFLGGGIGLRLT
jgi:hypothetical protein